MDQSKFRTILLQTVLIPFATVLLFACAALGLAFQLHRSMQWVDHTDQVIARSRLLLNLMVEMQDSVRGFALTGDEAALTPYREADRTVRAEFDELSQLVADNPQQKARLASTRQRFDHWQVNAEQAIAIRHSGAANTDLSRVLNRRQDMVQIRASMASFADAEQALRDQRSSAAARIWNSVATICIVLAVLLGVASSLFILRRIQSMAATFELALDSLTESEARFRSLVTASSDVVYRMSPDWLEMRDIRGRNILVEPTLPSRTWLKDNVHPDDHELVLRTIDLCIRTRTIFQLEHRINRIDGTVGWTFSRAIPLTDAKGRVVEWVGTASDVTERKVAELALIRTEKLAVVGRMAASIAHEINNPLAAVTNILFLAENSANDPNAVRHYLALADQELKRITHITRQTLGFYRESSAPSQTSIPAVIDSALDLMGAKIRSGRAIVRKRYAGDLQITAIAGELRQVFSNLIANSLDALAQSGDIIIHVTRHTTASNGETYIRATIADSGKGIDPDVLPRIFEPLFTTREGTGSGLGLWVSHQIIEKHGGIITVRSRSTGPSTGTVVSILLPIDPPLPESSAR